LWRASSLIVQGPQPMRFNVDHCEISIVSPDRRSSAQKACVTRFTTSISSLVA
jgi:hypothetical protein